MTIAASEGFNACPGVLCIFPGSPKSQLELAETELIEWHGSLTTTSCVVAAAADPVLGSENRQFA